MELENKLIENLFLEQMQKLTMEANKKSPSSSLLGRVSATNKPKDDDKAARISLDFLSQWYGG